MTLLELASKKTKEKVRDLNEATPSKIVEIVIKSLAAMEEVGIEVRVQTTYYGNNIGLENCYVSVAGAVMLYLNDRECFNKDSKELEPVGVNYEIYQLIDFSLCNGGAGIFVEEVYGEVMPTVIMACDTSPWVNLERFTNWLKEVEKVLIKNGL